MAEKSLKSVKKVEQATSELDAGAGDEGHFIDDVLDQPLRKKV